MATTFDLSDVPVADAADLTAAMQTLIASGRGLVFLNGPSAADLDAACSAIHSRHHAVPQASLAAGIRFRHLIEVFATRRLQHLMLDTGYAAIAPAAAIAARLRLNAHRGFNPQLFLMELTAALAENVISIDDHRHKFVHHDHRDAA